MNQCRAKLDSSHLCPQNVFAYFSTFAVYNYVLLNEYIEFGLEMPSSFHVFAGPSGKPVLGLYIPIMAHSSHVPELDRQL